MKKIVNINLGGYPFTIDVDAYEKMEHYFESLEKYFDGYDNPHEIIFDIEVRMAELFRENVGEQGIISLSDVNNAIGILGTPEDFSKENIENDIGEKKHYGKSTDNKNNRTSREYRVGKKIFRDPDNKILGGVCSGLANYLGIPDPIWIRLIFVILFFSGISPIIYIVLWIIIPAAKTTADKKEMRGEPIDIDTIAQSIEDEFNNLSDQFKGFRESIRNKKRKRRKR